MELRRSSEPTAMAAPLNERSVWLVVDDLIYLDAPEEHLLSPPAKSFVR